MLRPISPLLAFCGFVIGAAFSTIALGAEARLPRANLFVIDDFDGDIQNRLGGYRNTFARAPSVAQMRRVTGGPSGADGLCLRLKTKKAESGYCGCWMHLFDQHSTERRLLDASDWDALAFQVRGELGGEDVLIKVADAEWLKKDDSLPIGLVSRYLPGGITNEWQRVIVPLSDLKGLNRTQLGAISFQCDQPGEQTVYFDDVCVLRSETSNRKSPKGRRDVKLAALPAEATQPTSKPTPVRLSVSLAEQPRAMWIWTTDKLIGSTTEQEDLFAACEQDDIRILWMQLSYDRRANPVTASLVSASRPLVVEPSKTCLIRREPELRAFIKQAHQRGIQVQALDGYPEFALRANHAQPLSVVEAVIDFNRRTEPAARFDGIHFDNEPYLILGWSSPAYREVILHDFLWLNVECQRRCRAAGLQYGIDIPFWWQTRPNLQAEPTGIVTFEGIRKAASLHCIDRLDNVGIMNYRDAADGADGLLAHGRELLQYSDEVRGAEIFMGIETFVSEPATAQFIVGLPVDEFRAALRDRGRELAGLSRLHEFRLCRIDDGQRVHLGITLPGKPTAATQQQAHKALIELARAFGHVASGTPDDSLLESVATHINRETEWTGFARRDLTDADWDVRFPGFTTTQVMPSKVTFGDDSWADIREETRFAERGFGAFKRYRGLAIHSWESYRLKRPVAEIR